MLSRDIIASLKAKNGLSLIEIAHELGVDKQMVQELLQSLVRHGRVEELTNKLPCSGSCSCSTSIKASCAAEEKTYRIVSEALL